MKKVCRKKERTAESCIILATNAFRVEEAHFRLNAFNVTASLGLSGTPAIEPASQTKRADCWERYLPLQSFASMPSGGTVSTLPLLTSSQFVDNAVPFDSV